MKTILLSLAGSLLLWSLSARSQQFAISSFRINGGGGASAGDTYSIVGSVGQFDVGKMSGGDFAVDGGFLSIITAVQTPGAPTMRIELMAADTVLVAWPAKATGFVLEQTPTISSGNWIAVTNTPVNTGDEMQVTLQAVMGNKFFRLRHP